MNISIAGVVGCALALALFVPVTTFGGDAEPQEDQVNSGSTRGATAAKLPPIDVEAPKKTETATFGLG